MAAVKILSVRELSEYLGVTYYMARKLMYTKGFPSFMLTDEETTLKNVFAVCQDDVDEWIEKRKKSSRCKVG